MSNYNIIADEFNTTLSKLMKGLKKDAGVKSIRQNYKGTGSQKAVRQLWVRFTGGSVIDIWLQHHTISFGGVVANSVSGNVSPGNIEKVGTPQQTYQLIKSALIAWA